MTCALDDLRTLGDDVLELSSTNRYALIRLVVALLDDVALLVDVTFADQLAGHAGDRDPCQHVSVAMDLGAVIGVLLEPARQGRALVLEQRDDLAVRYDVTWTTDQYAQLSWRSVSETGEITESSAGTLRYRNPHSSDVHEEFRPAWAPWQIHNVAPRFAYIWGRPRDDWRLHSVVDQDGPLTTVRLISQEDSKYEAFLHVDTVGRIVREFRRPGLILKIEKFATRADLPLLNL